MISDWLLKVFLETTIISCSPGPFSYTSSLSPTSFTQETSWWSTGRWWWKLPLDASLRCFPFGLVLLSCLGSTSAFESLKNSARLCTLARPIHSGRPQSLGQVEHHIRASRTRLRWREDCTLPGCWKRLECIRIKFEFKWVNVTLELHLNVLLYEAGRAEMD